ncbi:Conserved protein containing a Zn-ribbon-like motif, possibly RNA-binding [Catalinimonas alkaloidigena]|uniref:Conserved protein containing a Zn-ribbon-like motif, possibly RNA-binding n=1 Tax=Catalinimonas alkaloidigena TaxID=1075417 RepID=A0A1G9DIV8_9BACT|nr:CGNR zinc finger domain-containing protein [Catalinimonas alkaloidigena]SDK63817.1 Conserved protein containing a Zn-ribbon-like motif, possibly RNA-binding [Catalinimonas alkaloidigena]
MRTFERTIETTELDGGWLCLNFTNTVRNRNEQPRHDYLRGVPEWLLWVKRLELVSAQEFAQLQQFAEAHPQVAEAQVGKILAFREIVFAVFHAVAQDQAPPPEVLAAFNATLSASLAQLRVAVLPERHVSESFRAEKVDLLTPFHPVVKSAYDLLHADWLGRVKLCGNCGWLYVDRSKNNSRKWCNMQTCGNSEKSMRYYRKHRQAE